MKKNTEIHVRPHMVSVYEGGEVQVINVVREQCATGRLPEVARALAKGFGVKGRPLKIREFDVLGNEIKPQKKPAADASRK